jgi:hypothetical protein
MKAASGVSALLKSSKNAVPVLLAPSHRYDSNIIPVSRNWHLIFTELDRIIVLKRIIKKVNFL